MSLIIILQLTLWPRSWNAKQISWIVTGAWEEYSLEDKNKDVAISETWFGTLRLALVAALMILLYR